MNGFSIFWTITIFFSLISFTIMSAAILYRSIPELRDMLRKLRESRQNRPSANHKN